MDIKPRFIEKKSLQRWGVIIASVIVNVALSALMDRFGVPLYLDTIGTIFIAMLCGSYYGMLTGVSTSILCGLFNDYSLFFLLIGMLIALLAAYFTKKDLLKKRYNILTLILIMALISGVLGTVFQYALLGRPQFDTIYENAYVMAGTSESMYIMWFVLLNIGVNILDKGISVIVALIVIHFIPEEHRLRLAQADWRQKPLSADEREAIENRGKIVWNSLRVKITALLLATTLGLVGIMAWVSIGIHYDSTVEQYSLKAGYVAAIAAEIVDKESLEEYVKRGLSIRNLRSDEYNSVNQRLIELREDNPDLVALYVYQAREDGWHVIYDTDPKFQSTGTLGGHVDYQAITDEDIDRLIEGLNIDPVVYSTRDGYFITVYAPVIAADGSTVAYVGAEVVADQYNGYLRAFFRKTFMVFGGFFLLVLGYGLWMSNYHLVYPIGAMAYYAEEFMQNMGEQSQLDERVRKFRKMSVKTGDEVESLYTSICEMAAGTAEQMREVRRFADTTAKMQNGLIITMADMVENRDSDTGAHVQKTAAYVKIILEGLKKKGYYAEKLTPKYMSDVEMSAPLHDVGKIQIPDAVLNKPGKLTPEEFEVMKTHTTEGKRIMEQAISTVNGENYLKEARNMAAYHHERWDGTGYPEGLHGQVIPLSARVMAVADVFDALTSARVYKPPFSIEKALEIIEDGAGSQFDPKCVEVFMEALPEVKLVLKKYQEY